MDLGFVEGFVKAKRNGKGFPYTNQPVIRFPFLSLIHIPDLNTVSMFAILLYIAMVTLELYLSNRYRQYGLWDRYSDVYPDEDLAYTVGISNYEMDWFFAQVNRCVFQCFYFKLSSLPVLLVLVLTLLCRNVGNKTYIPTTWRIIFDLDDVSETGNYILRLAIASAHEAELQVWKLSFLLLLFPYSFVILPCPPRFPNFEAYS